eukprot:COSAG06_NODE_1106_length_10684_cov_5.383656_1_plen_87_part_10
MSCAFLHLTLTRAHDGTPLALLRLGVGLGPAHELLQLPGPLLRARAAAARALPPASDGVWNWAFSKVTCRGWGGRVRRGAVQGPCTQ